MLRAWRERRHLSQMALALDVGVSPRHLSFVETGRARPSPELLLSMSEHLAVPLRERNDLLLAAGYAPRYAETPLDAPGLQAVRAALERLLAAHDPYPGVALDRHWNVVLANAAATRMLGLLPPQLAAAPVNMLRASLHPEGFAALTLNFAEWARHLLHELERARAASGDPALAALAHEVAGYPNVAALRAAAPPRPGYPESLLIPCVLTDGQGGRLSMFTTQATFGSPRDVTLAELTVELFYPADAATEAALRALAQGR
ncbi:helix-turn-helix domain-containing protein [Ottowia sp.]|uniref:MmyB family transcriptional regulator n=1 Tax=Ottowia sp. TaxID=1898956 RepID=UPI0039E4755B